MKIYRENIPGKNHSWFTIFRPQILVSDLLKSCWLWCPHSPGVLAGLLVGSVSDYSTISWLHFASWNLLDSQIIKSQLARFAAYQITPQLIARIIKKIVTVMTNNGWIHLYVFWIINNDLCQSKKLVCMFINYINCQNPSSSQLQVGFTQKWHNQHPPRQELYSKF